ncbi:MAG: hypothetical protein IJP46_05830 [Prevotella sp.]|nr:hypothetical protein [Prevotella sp.]
METNNMNFDSLVESIGQLMAMEEEDNDHKAAALYRAMFVNDKDINKLDFNYANSTFPVKSLESSKELPIFAS